MSFWLTILALSPLEPVTVTVVGLLVRADLGNGAMGNCMGGATVEEGLGAMVRSKMGPVAPVAGLKTLVGELGARVSLPPEVVVRLLGLTMRTIEGPPVGPPLPLTGMAWPLLESRMILLPADAAPLDDTAGRGPVPTGVVALEVVVAEPLDVTTTEAACAPPVDPVLPAGVGALM